MKRLFDFTAALFGLILLAPLLFLIAVLVKCTSRGPILFRQERIGRDLVPFRINKFRTMVVDAPERGGQLTHGTKDHRITAVGSLLRETKLDELPQLFNVLLGEMSLVGSRPEVPPYVEMFRDDFAEILRLRPGVTSAASVAYRREAEILGAADDPEEAYVRQVLPKKLALEKEYLSRQSFLLDLKIILLTLWPWRK